MWVLVIHSVHIFRNTYIYMFMNIVTIVEEESSLELGDRVRFLKIFINLKNSIRLYHVLSKEVG